MKTRVIAGLSFVFISTLATRGQADDHGGTFATASNIPAENPASRDFPGHLEAAGDVDMFRFTLSGTTMVWLYTTGATDTFLNLYNASGTRIGYDNNDGAGYNAQLFRTGASRLVPGVYYVSVSAGGGTSQPQAGDYVLGVRTQPNAAVFGNYDQNGVLSVLGEVDLYRFNIPGTTMAWLYTTGSIDTYIQLFDANGTRIDADQDDGAGYNAYVFRNGVGNLTAGTYYVSVTGGGVLNQPQTGNYALSRRIMPGATPLTMSNTNASLGVLGDVDLFRLQVSRLTMVWVYTTGLTDTRIDLYNSAGARIDYDESSGAGYNALIFRTGAERLAPGSYYITVSGGGVEGQPQTGAYVLSVRTQSNAQAINRPSIRRTLRGAGDIGVYRFDVQRPGMAFLHTMGNIDTMLQLFDGNGTSIEINNNAGAGYNALIDGNLPAGPYYLKVQGGGTASQPQTGSFTLCKRLPGNAEPVLGSGTLNRSISTYGEIDHYVIPNNTGNVDVQTTGSTNTYGSLWAGSGQLIESDEGSGPGDNFRITANVPAGNCFLSIRGSSMDLHRGNYALVSSFPSRPAVFPETDAWLAGSLRHTFRIAVKANKAWSVSDNVAWLSTGTTSGTGNGVLPVTVETNAGGERSGVIQVGGVPVKITQQGREARRPGDWNGDGSPDLVLQNTASGRTAAWFMSGAGIDGSSWFNGSANPAESLVNHGDFNGDMIPDQVWQNRTNGSINLRYCSGMSWASQGVIDMQPGTPNWRVVAVGDFSRVGIREMVLQSASTGALRIWRVDSARHVTWTGQFSVQPESSQWRAAAAGDINGDGKWDLLLQNRGSGQINAWLLNGTTVISTGALTMQPGSADWSVCAVEDFNDDGRADMILQEKTTGRMVLWFLGGRTVFNGGEIPQTSPDPSWNVRNSRSW